MHLYKELEVLKKELVELIIRHLRENKITAGTAQKLAADFLSVVDSIKDTHDLVNKLKNLGENYKEVGELYVEELNNVKIQERDAVLLRMRGFIQQGKIEDAIAIGRSLDQSSVT